MAAPTPSECPRELEIVTTRVFSAPREKVYGAFADPEKLVRWWGPKDFTNTFQEFDLRAGGAWRFVMHGPDGANYAQNKQFIEVVKPEASYSGTTSPSTISR